MSVCVRERDNVRKRKEWERKKERVREKDKKKERKKEKERKRERERVCVCVWMTSMNVWGCVRKESWRHKMVMESEDREGQGDIKTLFT